MLHDEFVSNWNVAKFLSKYDDGSVEQNYCKLITPEIGKKREIKAGGFDYKSLLRREKDTGGSNINDVAKFMSKHTGKDFDNCFIELKMPKIAHYSSGYSRGELLAARGFSDFI